MKGGARRGLPMTAPQTPEKPRREGEASGAGCALAAEARHPAPAAETETEA